MKNILITGGTGSLGSALVARWYSKHHLTVLSRDPHKQAKMAALYPNVRFILADICNYGEVYRACVGQDVLIHAAALKDVSTGEYHPVEFSRVNVQGTVTVAEAWSKTHESRGLNGMLPLQPRKALLISTDKAVNSLNCYGASKKVAEAVFRKYDYSALRYGNVIESAGSFVHKWQAAIEAGRPVKVRRPEPTRFVLMMDDALDLIEDALRQMEVVNGIYIPHSLKAFSIWDAAKELKATIEYEPLLPYEKQHERLLAEGEGYETASVLLSRVRPGGWGGEYKKFSSDNAPRLTGRQILEMLNWESQM